MNRNPWRLLGVALVASIGILSACGTPEGAPPPGINYYVLLEESAHTPASATGSIHAPFHHLLTGHVDDEGNVDYIALATDVAQLDAYLMAMESQIPAPAPARDPAAVSAEMAFWINVHNAAMLRGVVAAGIPESVTLVPDFFTRPVFAGLSLADIKDDKLRERFNDPRLHMVLSYAARGGPALEREAFAPEDLDWRLMRATVRFFNDKNRTHINPTTDIITLSRILKEYRGDAPDMPRCEYGEDFGTTHRQRRLWIAHYVPPSFSRYLKNNVPQQVVYPEFDWRLNRKPAAAPSPFVHIVDPTPSEP